jgi:uncharacterized membrane protein
MRRRNAGGTTDIGSRIAPWRFLLFLILAAALSAVLAASFGWQQGIMLGFDIAALAFMILCAPLFRHEADQMREMARRNDANRVLLLGITVIVSGVILVAVASELMQRGERQTMTIALVLATLVLSWLFSNLVYALHYAHLFYSSENDSKDCGGITIPETEEPDYWDFLYFSTCLGMTFQTSDVDITSRRIRRTVMVHCLAAFVFNLGVIAFSINVIGGGH